MKYAFVLTVTPYLIYGKGGHSSGGGSSGGSSSGGSTSNNTIF